MASVCSLGCDSAGSAGPSIPEEVQLGFNESCAVQGCHTSADRAASLSLEPGDSLSILGGPSTQSNLPLVDLGNIEGSYMALKLLPDDQIPEGLTRFKDRMPLNGLSGNDPTNVNEILTWINRGGPKGGGGGDAGSTGGTDGSTTVASGLTSVSAGTTGHTSGTTGSTATAGPSSPFCSVERVTDNVVDNPLVKGSGAGQWPVTVGNALEDQCGCHTVTDANLATEVGDLQAPGNALFLTMADLNRPLDGTTLGIRMEQEAFVSEGMPPATCPSINAEDRAVLIKWFNDGMPDGANFVPP